ncbi:hypothetical protein ACWCXK_39545 [Streptomyces sp. NPDC001739]
MADKFDFPQGLVDAQAQLYTVRAELSELYNHLPWSVAPLPGWTRTKEDGRYYESKRPDSPGWTDEEKQQVDDLRARQMELVTYAHPFWASCEKPVAARTALKYVVATETAEA